MKLPVMRNTHCSCDKNSIHTSFPYFASEKFVRTILMKHHTLFVKLFYKNNDCTPEALKKIRTLWGIKRGVDPMTVINLYKIIQKFEKTVPLDNRIT